MFARFFIFSLILIPLLFSLENEFPSIDNSLYYESSWEDNPFATKLSSKKTSDPIAVPVKKPYFEELAYYENFQSNSLEEGPQTLLVEKQSSSTTKNLFPTIPIYGKSLTLVPKKFLLSEESPFYSNPFQSIDNSPHFENSWNQNSRNQTSLIFFFKIKPYFEEPAYYENFQSNSLEEGPQTLLVEKQSSSSTKNPFPTIPIYGKSLTLVPEKYLLSEESPFYSKPFQSIDNSIHFETCSKESSFSPISIPCKEKQYYEKTAYFENFKSNSLEEGPQTLPSEKQSSSSTKNPFPTIPIYGKSLNIVLEKFLLSEESPFYSKSFQTTDNSPHFETSSIENSFTPITVPRREKQYYEKTAYFENFKNNSLEEGPQALLSEKQSASATKDHFPTIPIYGKSLIVVLEKHLFSEEGPFYTHYFFTPQNPNHNIPSPILCFKEKWYLIKKLCFSYPTPHKKQIPLEELEQLKTSLYLSERGYDVPEKGERTSICPCSINEPTSFSQAALQQIASTVIEQYNKKGIYGVDISLNELEDNTLTLQIRTAKIGQLETKKKSGNKEPICNHRKDSYYKKYSPIKEGDLFNKDELDDYLFYLNRFPSRRVDVNLKPMLGDEVGLEFFIDEKKPWVFWTNVANSGVKGTEKYVESAGYNHNHMICPDDIFRLFYSTDAFKHVHSFFTNYQAPLFLLKKTRWETAFGYNRFISTELGTLVRLYSGEQIPVSGKLIFTLFQHKNFFVDLIPSLEYRHVRVYNPSFAATHLYNDNIGVQNFLFPSLEIALQKKEREYQILLSVQGEASPTWGFSREKIDLLGRENTSHRWYTVKGDLSVSFYIDPLLVHSSATTSLVNEVSYRLRGEYAFKYRLIPQERMVLGGMNTVRGYRESTSFGDNYYLSSLEYMCHLPRLLTPGTAMKKVFGRPFKFVPEYKGGPTDWDLIFRAFLDVGRVTNNKKMIGEVNSTLTGAGIGLELIILENLFIRGDWGFRIKSVKSPNLRDFYGKGNSRGYLSLTLVF
ncbi:MAG: ShlB/FhaC/HecB family hemolysin secretion/activation protein [Chlamydiota bacterium]